MNLAIVMPLLFVHRSRKNQPAQSMGLVTNCLLHSTPAWHFRPSTTSAISASLEDLGFFHALVDSPTSPLDLPADDNAARLLCYTYDNVGEAGDDAVPGGSWTKTLQKLSNNQASGECKRANSNSHSQDPLLRDDFQSTLDFKMKKNGIKFPYGVDLMDTTGVIIQSESVDADYILRAGIINK